MKPVGCSGVFRYAGAQGLVHGCRALSLSFLTQEIFSFCEAVSSCDLLVNAKIIM